MAENQLHDISPFAADMGSRRRRNNNSHRSQTSPSSPTRSLSSSSSSSSSDFEFKVTKSPQRLKTALCPADELFYKGQLLPLHLSTRISMVRTLTFASDSSSRDSSGSSADSHSSFAATTDGCDSSRPSSVAEDDRAIDINSSDCTPQAAHHHHHHHQQQIKKNKYYFSLSRFSSVFRNPKTRAEPDPPGSGSSVKKMSSSAKEMFRRYLKKVKPLYEKLSKQQKGISAMNHLAARTAPLIHDRSVKVRDGRKKESLNLGRVGFSHSFSGNLRYPRRSYVASCPSSIRSSPNHSGVLSRNDGGNGAFAGRNGISSSSMEELQSAIQGAIAYCKSSLVVSHDEI